MTCKQVTAVSLTFLCLGQYWHLATESQVVVSFLKISAPIEHSDFRPISEALSDWKLISKFMLISSFRKKISSVNSELSKEINFEILFRYLERVPFCEISQKKFHLWRRHSDWSVGQCLQTSNEALTASSMLAFESLFPM